MKCEYGCDQQALYKMTSGKWCCSPYYSSCPSMKFKNKWSLINSRIKNEWSKDESKFYLLRLLVKILRTKSKPKFCEYGCGNIAKYKMLSGKWCCSKKYTNCPVNKKKYGSPGKSNAMYGKKHKKTTIELIRKKRIEKGFRFFKDDYEKHHPLFCKIEEIKNRKDGLGIQVHCKNHNCLNSKEQGGWFNPTGGQVSERIRVINNGNDANYFYCCEECKQECPLFRLKSTSVINQNNLPSEVYYTNEEYQIFRNEVLKRTNYKCEYCSEVANTVHHSRPQKLEPFHSLDPDFGIACCESCHYKHGHKDECSTGNLANKVCL